MMGFQRKRASQKGTNAADGGYAAPARATARQSQVIATSPGRRGFRLCIAREDLISLLHPDNDLARNICTSETTYHTSDGRTVDRHDRSSARDLDEGRDRQHSIAYCHIWPWRLVWPRNGPESNGFLGFSVLARPFRRRETGMEAVMEDATDSEGNRTGKKNGARQGRRLQLT